MQRKKNETIRTPANGLVQKQGSPLISTESGEEEQKLSARRSEPRAQKTTSKTEDNPKKNRLKQEFSAFTLQGKAAGPKVGRKAAVWKR